MVVELSAAFLSRLIPLTKDETTIAIMIKTIAKPSFPLSGVTATISKVETEVKSAPNTSGSKFFSFGRQGFCGLTCEIT